MGATELGWLLQGGTVLDGRGGREASDVLVAGERIEAVLPRGAGMAAPAVPPTRRLDCAGLLIAPGFIDAHTHDDTAAADPARYEAKIRQGVTASVVGQDGFGWGPLPGPCRAGVVRYWRPVNGLPMLPDGSDLAHPRLAGYLRALDGRAGLHVAALAGHANLRVAAAGWALRPLRPEERDRMVGGLEEALDDGACGLSTGLTYVPACASDLEELLPLCAVLARRDRPYVSHIRGYGAGIFDAVDEALELARRTGCAVHLSHLHLSARAVWGQAERLLERLDRAIRQGLRVTWDLYPYQAGSSVLYQYLPAGLQDGGPEAFLRWLAGPGAAGALAADAGFARTDWSAFVVSHTSSGRHVGRTVAEVAGELRLAPAEAVVRLLVEEELDVGCVVHQTDEADDRLFLLHPSCVVGSDGIFASGRPHPRARGAFARFWRLFAAGPAPAIAPAEAARRMAGAAAGIHRLDGCGAVRAGAWADLAVFDGHTFADEATYAEPERPAAGMRHVLVRGRPVLLHGRFDAGVRAGRPL